MKSGAARSRRHIQVSLIWLLRGFEKLTRRLTFSAINSYSMNHTHHDDRKHWSLAPGFFISNDESVFMAADVVWQQQAGTCDPEWKSRRALRFKRFYQFLEEVQMKQKMKKRKHHHKNNNKVHEDALALLGDPCFLYLALRKTGELGVVGELKNRLVLFLGALTKDLPRPVSILVKGPRSTGKNNVIKAVINLLPPESLLPRSSLTKKALAYGKDPLGGKVFYLYQLDGGRESQLLMRMLQSEGGLAHEYTDMTGGKRATQVNRREGTPVILTTTTTERIYEDDETRFLSVRSDDSQELTEEVINAEFSEDADARK